MNTWRERTTRELYEYIAKTMPPGRATLPAETYLAITAHILQTNGAPAGRAGVHGATAAAIGSVATGQPATAQAAPRGGDASPPAGTQADAGRATRRAALTVAGEVKNYRPVTDEMLRNPPPGDWLMMRRNYQAWSHSPLTQITDEQRREPAARVGVGDERGAARISRRRSSTTASCFSPTRCNTVQALDAATGDLIWEHELGPTQADRLRVDAQHRDLRGQGDRRDDRCAARGARREDRPIALDDADCRSHEGLLHDQRSDRRARQDHSGAAGLRSLPGRSLLHQRLRRGDRQAAVEVPHRRADRTSRAATRGASCPTCMRAGGDTWMAGSYDPDLDLTYWGIAQAKPWMPVSRGTSVRDAALYTASTVALRPIGRHRWPGTTSTCPASRSTSTRCSSAC